MAHQKENKMTKRRKLETKTGDFEYWIDSKKTHIIDMSNDMEYAVPNKKFNKQSIEDIDVINWVHIHVLNIAPLVQEENQYNRKLSVSLIPNELSGEKQHLYGYSPLFDPISEVEDTSGYFHILNVKNNCLSISKEYYSDITPVRDITEAEIKVFQSIQPIETSMNDIINTIYSVSRKMNEETKRPCDKIILVNPDIVVDLLSCDSTVPRNNSIEDIKSAEKSVRYTGGRYKFEANLFPGQNLRIYSYDLVPLNSVYIIHSDNSQIDKGAFLVRNKKSDCLRLHKGYDINSKIKKIIIKE